MLKVRGGVLPAAGWRGGLRCTWWQRPWSLARARRQNAPFPSWSFWRCCQTPPVLAPPSTPTKNTSGAQSVYYYYRTVHEVGNDGTCIHLNYCIIFIPVNYYSTVTVFITIHVKMQLEWRNENTNKTFTWCTKPPVYYSNYSVILCAK